MIVPDKTIVYYSIAGDPDGGDGRNFSVNHVNNNVSNLAIANLSTEDSYVFSKDVMEVIKQLLYFYKFRKITSCTYNENLIKCVM